MKTSVALVAVLYHFVFKQMFCFIFHTKVKFNDVHGELIRLISCLSKQVSEQLQCNAGRRVTDTAALTKL